MGPCHLRFFSESQVGEKFFSLEEKRKSVLTLTQASQVIVCSHSYEFWGKNNEAKEFYFKGREKKKLIQERTWTSPERGEALNDVSEWVLCWFFPRFP